MRIQELGQPDEEASLFFFYPFQSPDGPLFRDAVDPVDAVVVPLPGWDAGGAVGDVGTSGVVGSEAEVLGAGHRVLEDECVPDVVVALSQLLLAGHPDLSVPEVFHVLCLDKAYSYHDLNGRDPVDGGPWS